MNIRVYLSHTRGGSDEKVIEYIEKAITESEPFGLSCQRSKVIFFPDTFTGYWVWSDMSPGPVFKAIGIGEFIDTVRMQYMSHKDLLILEDVLYIIKLMKDAKPKQMEPVQRHLLSESGEPARQVEPGAIRILPGGTDEFSQVSEHSSAAAESKLLPVAVRDAESLLEDEGGSVTGS